MGSRTCKSASTRRNLQRRGNPKQRNGSRMVQSRCCQLSSKSHQIRRLKNRKWMCNVDLGDFEIGRPEFNEACVTSLLRTEWPQCKPTDLKKKHVRKAMIFGWIYKQSIHHTSP